METGAEGCPQVVPWWLVDASDKPAEAAAFAASMQTCCPVDQIASLACSA